MLNSQATLLIADDEPSIRLSLSQSLAEMGYKVRTAVDGFSALREIRNELPEFLLARLQMHFFKREAASWH
jgi:DNA-binding NtrC family response regulator